MRAGRLFLVIFTAALILVPTIGAAQESTTESFTITATPGTNVVSLTWVPVTNPDGFEAYRIQRRAETEADWQWHLSFPDATTGQAIDRVPEGRFRYRLVLVRKVGQSETFETSPNRGVEVSGNTATVFQPVNDDPLPQPVTTPGAVAPPPPGSGVALTDLPRVPTEPSGGTENGPQPTPRPLPSLEGPGTVEVPTGRPNLPPTVAMITTQPTPTFSEALPYASTQETVTVTETVGEYVDAPLIEGGNVVTYTERRDSRPILLGVSGALLLLVVGAHIVRFLMTGTANN